MALKRRINELCRQCGKVDAEMREDCIKTGHMCDKPIPGPPDAPRTFRWSEAYFVDRNGVTFFAWTKPPEAPGKAADKIVAYRMKMPDIGGDLWLHVGTTSDQVANAVKMALMSQESAPADECVTIVLEPYETTQEQIDAMPDFPGFV